MTHPVRKATILYSDGSGLTLTLLKLRERAYRWSKREPSGAEVPFDDAEHPDIAQAIKALRVACDADERKPDLTVMGIEDGPDRRAARRIASELVTVELVCSPEWQDMASEIIAEETNVANLAAALNGILTYLLTRLSTKDQLLNPLMLEAVVQLEKADKNDYSNVKKRLSEAIAEANQMIKLAQTKGYVSLN